MGKKRLHVAALILLAAGAGVMVLTFLLRTPARTEKNLPGVSGAGGVRAGDQAQVHSQENPAPVRAQEPPVGVAATGAGEKVPVDESLVPLPEHNPLAVTIALEKMKRPDLKDKPSGPERIKAHHTTLQIPEDELATLPTNRLLQKVVSTPLVVQMMLDSYPDGGLASFAQSFNGVEAFLQRPDAAALLLREYDRLSDTIAAAVEPDPFYVKSEQLRVSPSPEPLRQYMKDAPWEKRPFCFTVMEVLMTSPQVMDQQRDANQRTQVVSALLKCVDARVHFDALQPQPVYGKAIRDYSALALAKYLEALRVPEYTRWYSTKREEGLFVERSATRAEAEEIINLARAYLHPSAGTPAVPRPAGSQE